MNVEIGTEAPILGIFVSNFRHFFFAVQSVVEYIAGHAVSQHGKAIVNLGHSVVLLAVSVHVHYHRPGCGPITDKKENQIFLIYKEIQMVSGAKSYMSKGFLIYEEMRKYLTIYEEAVSHHI
jgi:hypothetical protein